MFSSNASQASDPIFIEDVFSTWLVKPTTVYTTYSVTNGIALAATESWFAGLLVEGSSRSKSIAVDSNGDIFISGRGTLGGNSYSALSKHSPNGTLIWQRKLSAGTGVAGDHGSNVAVDSSGNAYICFDPTTNSGLSVAKYNSSGTIQWQRKLVQAGSFGRGIAVSSGGTVYVVGTTAPSGNHSTIAKYNTSGTIQWQRKLAIGDSYGIGISIDSSENVYVDSYIFTDDGAQKNIAKFNTSGTIQWQRNTTSAASNFNSIAATSAGDVYAVGSTHIFKYNTSGTNQWQRRITTASFICVAVDASGNIYAGGSDSGFGFLVKYNTSGTIQWKRSFVSGGTCNDVTTDTNGNVYAVGITATSQGFVVRLKQDGTVVGGTANGVFMRSDSATDSAGTATLATGTATESASTATESADTTTDSAGTLTYSVGAQPAIGAGSAGGMVWMKARDAAANHLLYDTVRGASAGSNNALIPNGTNAQQTAYFDYITGLSNGFTVNFVTGGGQLTNDGINYVSWTFRKRPKFFDIVTWTGTGAQQTLTHSLGGMPGMIIGKNLSGSGGWGVWHRNDGTTPKLLYLDSSAAADSPASTVTDSTFTTNDFGGAVGNQYIAYLFAHNAGGFGLTGADNVISCGSFVTNGSGFGSATLGYEPQWVMFKATAASNWEIYDTMRGLPGSTGTNAYIYANGSGAETTLTSSDRCLINATGFSLTAGAGYTYIYIAIRRPMKVPTLGTSVYNAIARSGTGVNTTVTGVGFTPDLFIAPFRSGSDGGGARPVCDRLRNTRVVLTNDTVAEGTYNDYAVTNWGMMDGVGIADGTYGLVNRSGNNYINWFFKRAPGFFDEVCYTGNGTTITLSHNLTVPPELFIIKCRNGTTNWSVPQTMISGGNSFLALNLTGGISTVGAGEILGNNVTYVAPTSTVFTLGSQVQSNNSGFNYVAYLFATCPGVSKVGSYTGNGTDQTINCGFTGGARFILIKRTDSTGSWYVWDTVRGIIDGNDFYLLLNNTTVETSIDYIYTNNAGFGLRSAAPADINANGGTYIFLAIA